MKSIIIAIIVMLIPAMAFADETQYEVTISVTYNAVSPRKAAEIIEKAQIEHAGACKVEIKSKKVSSDTGTLVFSGVTDGQWYYAPMPNVYPGDLTGTFELCFYEKDFAAFYCNDGYYIGENKNSVTDIYCCK